MGFFLFNDLLVYGNIVINKKKYNKQHLIPLEEVKLKSLEDEGQFKNGWLICTRGKSFAVFAATATETQEWMAHINKCIEDLLRKSEKRQWTSMLLSGCRTVKLALACAAKRSNSRWSIVAITAESVGLCAAMHVVQRGSSSRRNPPNR